MPTFWRFVSANFYPAFNEVLLPIMDNAIGTIKTKL